jgi:hypothetical protein
MSAVDYIRISHRYSFGIPVRYPLPASVADLGFSGGGGMVWGTRGRVREGGTPSRRGSGGLAPGKFFANRRRIYAFSRPCLGSICLFHHFIV